MNDKYMAELFSKVEANIADLEVLFEQINERRAEIQRLNLLLKELVEK